MLTIVVSSNEITYFNSTNKTIIPTIFFYKLQNIINSNENMPTSE